jgi:hypothetical protein
MTHRAEMLIRHENQHIARDKYKCSLCDFCFLSVQACRDHGLTHHATQIRCEVCDRGFPSYFRLVQHRQIHEDSGLTCLECKFVAQSEISLRAHYRQEHPLQPHEIRGKAHTLHLEVLATQNESSLLSVKPKRPKTKKEFFAALPPRITIDTGQETRPTEIPTRRELALVPTFENIFGNTKSVIQPVKEESLDATLESLKLETGLEMSHDLRPYLAILTQREDYQLSDLSPIALPPIEVLLSKESTADLPLGSTSTLTLDGFCSDKETGGYVRVINPTMRPEYVHIEERNSGPIRGIGQVNHWHLPPFSNIQTWNEVQKACAQYEFSE